MGITEDDDFIRDAVAGAEISPLLAAIACLTGDRRVLDEGTRPDVANMLVPDMGFTAEDFARSRAAAVDALVRYRDAGSPPVPPPDDATIDSIIEWITGGDHVRDRLEMFREELDVRGVDGRAPEWRLADVAPDRSFRVAVIGAGMSGLAAAHRLRQAGVDVVLLDKNDDVGGTWLENTYPGCRVDVPTFFYSYSFAQRTHWPETYSRQGVLLDYFRACADEFDLRPLVRFGTEVTRASWDDADQQWQLDLRTASGVETVVVDAVVSAVGQLNRPKIPDLPGAETFAGPAFHTARWRHDVDLAGKRVCVIGTGASAAQVIPQIAPDVAHLDVFQRTPNWLAPSVSIADEITDGTRWLFEHVPSFSHWWRLFQFWRLAEGMQPAAKVDPDWEGLPTTVSPLNAFVRDVFADHLRTTFAADPELLAKVMPTYPPIAKRVIRDDGIWAETLMRDNVALFTAGIAEITAEGVMDTDGVLHPCDVIIYGTGFHAAEFLMPMEVIGRDGAELHARWRGDARAYMGITVPGFPNLFCMYGPNTNVVVNGSIIFFSEAEANYVVESVKALLETGSRSMACTEAAHDRYNEWIDAGNASMAWGVSDVNSWYKNQLGRVAQNWPFSLHEFWTQTRSVDASAYDWR